MKTHSSFKSSDLKNTEESPRTSEALAFRLELNPRTPTGERSVLELDHGSGHYITVLLTRSENLSRALIRISAELLFHRHCCGDSLRSRLLTKVRRMYG